MTDTPTATIYVSESHVNATEGSRMGEQEPYASYFDTSWFRRRILRDLMREHGRIVSKVYIDTPTGTQAIGYVFVKRDRYEDTGDPFLHETWVTLHTAPDDVAVTRTSHYLP